MRRAERADDSWSGHWSFPGGRWEPSDLNLLETALRELAEECGVHLRPDDMVAEWPSRFARRRGAAYVPVTPFFFRTDSELPVVPDEAETAEAVWIPIALLRDRSRHRFLPIPGMPPELLFPGIPLNRGPLWGFTYRLVCDWLGLATEPGEVGSAAFRAASSIAEFLASSGLTVRQPWQGPEAVTEGGPITVAEVAGAIPAQAVVDWFARPGEYVASLSCLEVRRDVVRVVGLSFEEYLIRSVG